MAIFVINEWLPEDSSGINGLEAQKTALRVITMLAASDHQIVVIAESEFEKKFWKLCKSDKIPVRGIVREYLLTLRWNSDRCLVLKAEETAALPAELASATKLDDHYLIQAQLSLVGAVLVTTDKPLGEAVGKAGLSCLSREEFLTTYF